MKLLVTPAPHAKSRLSANDMYAITSIALSMCLIYAMSAFKLKASIFYILIASVVTCFVVEFILHYLKTKKWELTDFSWLVTALMLTCIAPINAPWQTMILAGAIAILIKYIFGGIGNNIFNPAGLGRCAVGVLFSGFSFGYYGSEATTLELLISGQKSLIEIDKAMFGNVPGAIGTGCLLLILIIAVVFVIFKIIRWENLLFATIGFIITVWPLMGATNIIPAFLSGSFIFVTVFMLSDPTTSPYGFSAGCVYALVFGLLSGVFMSYNIMGETAVFLALIIANFIAPACDKLFVYFKRGIRKND